MGKKKSKRKINIIALVVILLALYLVFSFVYYIMTLPIKNIYIEGNTYIKDVEIIETAKIKNYPSLIKISRRKVKKNLLKNEFINSVTIKKKLNGTIKIIVDESKPLFYNRTNKKLVLLNGKEVDGSSLNDKVPSLINIVPNDIYKKLIKAFEKVDYNIITQISEIEYDPDIINGKTIDPDRFYLRMVDGNSVYINPVNIKRLNNYFDVYDRLPEGVKGTLYFDSNSDNNMFKKYGSKTASEVATNEN